MDWATIISIVGIVGTWITIVLVYFTLREMRNQRIASQKPDLILPKSIVHGYVYAREGKTVLVPRYWSNDKAVKDEMLNWERSGLLRLYNVGFGVAKNIELKWIGYYDEALQEIRDYCYQNSVPIILKSEGDGVFVESDVFTSLSPQTFNHDFLMPSSITSEGLTSSVPDAFVELVSIMIYLKYHYGRRHLNEMSEVEVSTLPMKLEINYDDLENSHYSKKFEVRFSVSGLHIYADEKSLKGLKPLFHGTFEFKNIK